MENRQVIAVTVNGEEKCSVSHNVRDHEAPTVEEIVLRSGDQELVLDWHTAAWFAWVLARETGQ